MKKKAVTLFTIAICALAQSATLDGLAAKVNDAVITIGDVATEMRRMGNPGEDFKTAYSNALEEVINRRLILKAALDRKLEMQEWLVDNRIREIVKDNFGGDMNKLNAQLAQSRVALTDWRNQIRDDMIVNAMRFQLVDKGAEATPAAMRKEYEKNRARYRRDATVTVSVILLKPAEDDNTSPVSTRAEELVSRIEKGEAFADLAKKFSADSHAKDGGLWKDIKPEQEFRQEIADEIAKLKPGEFSRPLILDGWGFIVRKESEDGAKELSFSEAYEEVARNVRKDLLKKRHAEWIARMREEAFIKIYPLPDENL